MTCCNNPDPHPVEVRGEVVNIICANCLRDGNTVWEAMASAKQAAMSSAESAMASAVAAAFATENARKRG